MSALWLNGTPIDVQTDDLGVPINFTWQERSYRVEHVYRRWRVDSDWWRSAGDASATTDGHVWREYFKLTTTNGLLLIVYRDFNSGHWQLQRMYD